MTEGARVAAPTIAAMSHRAPAYDLPPTVLLRAREVAERLNVHIRTVWRLADRGYLPRVRISEGVCRFRAEDVERLIQSALKDEDPAVEPGPVTTPAGAGGGYGREYS